jgi:hypothetical protein
MLCAHTVRRLKPGAFEDFATAFGPPAEGVPAGWVRFVMLRKRGDEDQVVTFGFFDGTLEELEASQADHHFEERRDAAGAYVEEVIANGVYDVVVDHRAEGAMTA